MKEEKIKKKEIYKERKIVHCKWNANAMHLH